jgi:hypothetical protein
MGVIVASLPGARVADPVLHLHTCTGLHFSVLLVLHQPQEEVMRRALLSLGSAALLTLVVAGTAFGAHCVNESKPNGAGVHGVVLLDPVTFEATFPDANAAGRLPGGFADVYIDADDSGTLTEADIQIEDDIFLVANHSHKDNPAQGSPAILPPVLDGRDPGGDGRGVGTRD